MKWIPNSADRIADGRERPLRSLDSTGAVGTVLTRLGASLRLTPEPLHGPTARDEVVHDQDDRDDQQQVDQPAAEVPDEPQEPEHNQNADDGPQHDDRPQTGMGLTSPCIHLYTRVIT